MNEQAAGERTAVENIAALTDVLLSGNGQGETISAAIKLLCEIFDGEGAILWLIDEEHQELRRKVIVHNEGSRSKAFEMESTNERLKFGEAIAGQVWAEGAARLLQLPAMFGQTPNPGDAALPEQEIRALAFPIYGAGTIFGVVEIVSCSVTEIDQTAQQLTRIVGSQLGTFVYAEAAAERMAQCREQVAELTVSMKGADDDLRAAKLRLAREHDRAVQTSMFNTQYLKKIARDIRAPLSGVLGVIDLLERSGLQRHQLEYTAIVRESADVLHDLVADVDAYSSGEAGLFAPIEAEETMAPEAVVETTVDASAEQLADARVLVVNGMIGSAEFVEAYATAAGIKCQSATRGYSALTELRQAALSNKPFDVVFVEMVLPDMDAYEFARIVTKDRELAAVKLVLVSTFESTPRSDKAMKAGFALHLAKPMKQKQVVGAIHAVLEGASRIEKISTALEVQMTPAALSGEPMILVAEDNPVNQKVALLQLKELGFYAKLVTNGKEAVEAVKQGGFAAVLMDAQMPEMDGFEATRQIRRWEQTTGSRITIIAMTASALSVDREKCLAAGMDDYLSKPVTYDKLGSVLSKWIELKDSAKKFAAPSTAGENAMDKQPSGENLQFAPDTSVTAAEPIDIGSLEEMVGAEEVVDILNLFVSSSQELLDKISGASTKHDGKALREAAHELKGACASIGASNMARTCQELENAARNDEWDMVPNLESGLSENFQLAKNYIEMKLS